VRQYARERLLEASEAEIAGGEHLKFFTAFAERAEPELRGPDQATWFERLERENDNLRAALERSRTHPNELDQGLRLAGALWWFWAIWSYWSEGREWVETLLALDDPASRTTERAKALVGASHMVRLGSPGPVELQQARAYSEAALDLYRKLGDKQGMAHALYALGMAAKMRGDGGQAVLLGEQSLAQAREMGDKWIMAEALLHLVAHSAWDANDRERLASIQQESRALYQELGDIRGLRIAYLFQGGLAEAQGDLEQAEQFLSESLAQARKLGSNRETANTLGYLAHNVLRQGKSAQATQFGREGLRLYRQLGWDREVVEKVRFLGVTARAGGDPERAARLLGAEARKRTQMGEPPSAFLEEQIAAVRASLHEEVFATAWAEGQAMTWEQAISYALEEPAGDAPAP
jgi:tetratricopeptide (TPR) repeat protein